MSNASPDPALAAVSKQVVTLQADISNLRKGMVQQLTLSGKLIKAVFALDDDYFGGRFQAQQDQENPDPFRDFTVATKVVEAVSEEVQGGSAFADSPLLRDGIANLITALEATRGVALEMEKSGIEAVGLPVKPQGMNTRVFPENNALGCLAETAGSVHDLSAMMSRTRDRFSAMRMMMNEAERARTEAESVVTPVNVEKVAAAITDELKKVQQELKTTRAQLMSTLDSHAQKEKSLLAELERARREAAYEADTRKSDRAEARSLAAEIARQIENAMPPGGSDDLEITLSVLREALNEGQDLAALAAATEGVVVDWVRLTSEHSAKAVAPATKADDGRLAAELTAATAAKAALEKDLAAARAAAAEAAQLKAKLIDVERRASGAEQELTKEKERTSQSAAAGSAELAAAKAAAAEVAQLKAKLVDVERRASGAEQELTKEKERTSQSAAAGSAELATAKSAAAETAQLKAKLVDAERRASSAEQELTKQKERAVQAAAAESAELTAVKVKLAEAETGLAVRERELVAAKEASGGAQRKLSDTQGQLEAATKAAQQGGEATNRDVVALRAQLSQATTTLRLKEDEAKRAKEALQQEQAKHGDAFQNLTRQLHAAQEKLAVTTSELQTARTQTGESNRQMSELQTRLTQQRESEVKQVRDTHARELKQTIDAKVIAETKLQQLDVSAKQLEIQRAADLADARKTIAALEARATELQAKIDTANAETTRLKGEVGRIGAEQAKVTASLEFATARERQISTERERLDRERAELQARLDALRKTSDATVNQSEQTLVGLKKQLAESKAAEAEVRAQLTRMATEASVLGEKQGKSKQELVALRSEKDRVSASIQTVTQERDQARLKLSEIERERARQTEASARSEANARTLTAEVAALKRSEQESTLRADKLTAELAQVRERLTASQQLGAQASAQQTSLKELELRLTGERDAARTAATTAAVERDRLKAQADRLQADHDALAKRLDEREGQLTARVNDTSRQLGELKETNTRLAAENERLQSEGQRAANARNDAKEALERKESTSTWTKRLSDTAAQVDQARVRAADLERKVDEQRHQLAQFEERLARQTQGEVHLRERVGEVERREVALQQQLAGTKVEAEQARAKLMVLERELATAQTAITDAEARRERQKVRFDALMREARDAVASAAKRQDQIETADKEIISELMRQIQDLRLRTGTNS